VLEASLLAAAAMALARAWLVAEGVGGAARLAAVVALGAVVYVPACAWRGPDIVAEAMRIARRGGRTPPAEVAPA
jgi:hypothetical protein